MAGLYPQMLTMIIQSNPDNRAGRVANWNNGLPASRWLQKLFQRIVQRLRILYPDYGINPVAYVWACEWIDRCFL